MRLSNWLRGIAWAAASIVFPQATEIISLEFNIPNKTLAAAIPSLSDKFDSSTVFGITTQPVSPYFAWSDLEMTVSEIDF